MKKLVFILFLGTVLLSCKKVDPDADLAGINVIISGRLTQSCEDSTPVKYQVLRVSDEVTQNFPVTTDSNGRFSFTTPATRTSFFIRANSKIILGGSFCFETKDIGTIFLNPCAKAIVHYDTSELKKNYKSPFGVMYKSIFLQKSNLSSLSRPDTIKTRCAV